MAKDYYSLLGVQKSASKDEVKKAFRTLAHKHHPDKGGDAEKFKEINEAYSVLSDDSKRAQYDQYGSAGPAGGFDGGQAGYSGGFGDFDFSQFTQGFGQAQGGQGGGIEFDLGDIFSAFGGGQRQKKPQGHDIAVDLELSFEESIFGLERTILLNKTSTCENCGGNGAEKGTDLETCSTCKGSGQIHEVKRSIFGQFETARTCTTCNGSGKIPKTKCHTCKGQGVYKKQSEIKVIIPPGVEEGEMMRLSGAGEAVQGGTSGDLYITLHIKKHSNLHKEGHNLRMDLHIKLTDAILGATYPIKTLDGTVDMKTPEGIQHAEVLKIKGKGVPYDQAGTKRGDILITVYVDIPTKLSKDTRKKIEELRKSGI